MKRFSLLIEETQEEMTDEFNAKLPPVVDDMIGDEFADDMGDEFTGDMGEEENVESLHDLMKQFIKELDPEVLPEETRDAFDTILAGIEEEEAAGEDLEGEISDETEGADEIEDEEEAPEEEPEKEDKKDKEVSEKKFRSLL